jgi:hypothetical protein
MNTNTNTTSNKMSETMSTVIALGIFAVIAIVGILYGMQLDAIGY